jgi:ketosteroid isomerase-like protein
MRRRLAGPTSTVPPRVEFGSLPLRGNSGDTARTMSITRDQAEAYIAAINRRDFDALNAFDWVDPYLEFHSAIAATEGTHYVGAAGVRQWAEDSDAVWPGMQVQITDFRPLTDERVLVLYRLTGQARGSGMPLDQATAQVWDIEKGKLKRATAYFRPQDALEAVGLSE